ncbi:MAG: hypothetical protein JNJ54_17075 [Myxococcaceae bacterium]|nr:hypothetical protein [Myxococcaceae bacterium]
MRARHHRFEVVRWKGEAELIFAWKVLGTALMKILDGHGPITLSAAQRARVKALFLRTRASADARYLLACDWSPRLARTLALPSLAVGADDDDDHDLDCMSCLKLGVALAQPAAQRQAALLRGWAKESPDVYTLRRALVGISPQAAVEVLTRSLASPRLSDPRVLANAQFLWAQWGGGLRGADRKRLGEALGRSFVQHLPPRGTRAFVRKWRDCLWSLDGTQERLLDGSDEGESALGPESRLLMRHVSSALRELGHDVEADLASELP